MSMTKGVMEQTHTPGPWQTRFCADGGYDCMTDAWFVDRGMLTPTIATIDLRNYGQPNCGAVPQDAAARAAADARLIAAAPELRDALAAFVRADDMLLPGAQNNNGRDYQHIIDSGKLQDEAVATARALLARLEVTL